jgi:hypothetical protein
MSRPGTCDVCGKEGDVACFASSFGPISYAYCEDCFNKDMEPYDGMVAYIACGGRFPEDINPAHAAKVRRILEELGVSEDRFISDVNTCIDSSMEGSEMNNQLTEEITRVVESAGYKVEVYEVEGSDVIGIIEYDDDKYGCADHNLAFADLGHRLILEGHAFNYRIQKVSCDYVTGVFEINDTVRIEFDFFTGRVD